MPARRQLCCWGVGRAQNIVRGRGRRHGRHGGPAEGERGRAHRALHVAPEDSEARDAGTSSTVCSSRVQVPSCAPSHADNYPFFKKIYIKIFFKGHVGNKRLDLQAGSRLREIKASKRRLLQNMVVCWGGADGGAEEDVRLCILGQVVVKSPTTPLFICMYVCRSSLNPKHPSSFCSKLRRSVHHACEHSSIC